ncbi:MAG: hypothetical protein CSB33_01935 [Desulfobacterales bacterium]|nr:MAG: hypothetical protein CSB33_01935 [Desulfobacterales bacterium]
MTASSSISSDSPSPSGSGKSGAEMTAGRLFFISSLYGDVNPGLLTALNRYPDVIVRPDGQFGFLSSELGGLLNQYNQRLEKRKSSIRNELSQTRLGNADAWSLFRELALKLAVGKDAARENAVFAVHDPDIAARAGLYARVFPEAKFIFTTRNPLWKPPEGGADAWKRAAVRLFPLKKSVAGILPVREERLLSEPMELLRDILSFLERPMPDSMRLMKMISAAETGAVHMEDLRGRMPAADPDLVEDLASSLKFFGYEEG